MTTSDLPALNAALNALATVFLTLGWIFIRRGQRDAHRRCMIAALVTSGVFLCCYVLHKYLVRGVHTPFGGSGPVKYFYYFILLTHVVLAMAIVPLVLMTVSRALKERFELHKKIARWTWPIWMYVSVTGVLVYFMLYKWFPVVK